MKAKLFWFGITVVAIIGQLWHILVEKVTGKNPLDPEDDNNES